ncbi:hypothetical protein MAPG_08850 [Magnaporthiopsis poae ATCC 64411]|uniref:Uncharacterized protein n=1 Tax=Magnaporthiopsis poae (strain ATCC 64411 / 73-15) TaxID=644358 RepID=A0A0C4E8F0_MAGP6|nr:hypothetical protein MAPG_08850 [Magnaporthiopsis poae ATCC 64411]
MAVPRPPGFAFLATRFNWNDDDIEQQRNVENNIQTRLLRGHDLNSRLPLRQRNNGFIRIPASICHRIWRTIWDLMRASIISFVLLLLAFGWLFWDLHNDKLNPFLLVAIVLLIVLVQVTPGLSRKHRNVKV